MSERDPFLESREWRVIRMRALERDGARCAACGRTAADGIIINVDHIKNRWRWPELALDVDNLQVLCNECNHGKGNTYNTDWRRQRLSLRGQEQAMIGWALIDNERIPALKSHQFAYPPHAILASAVAEIHEATGAVDVVALHEWLETQDYLEYVGGLSYLGNCIEIVDTAAA